MTRSLRSWYGRRLVRAAASVAVASLVGQHALGATAGTWNQGVSGNFNFLDSGNWINLNVPSGADSTADFTHINFLGDETINFGAASTLGGLSASDLDISSGANLIFTGSPVTLSTTTGQPTFNIGTMSVFGNYLRFDNSLAGNNGLVKTGAGIFWLNGVNTYSGATVISGGTLRASSAANFGTSTVLLNGGTLDLRNDTSTNFGVNVTLGANSSINVDSLPGSSVQNQTHTIGALNFGAAGATRTLTITNVNANTPPTAETNNFGFAAGVVTLNDNAVFNSNLTAAITLGGVTSNAATASTFTVGGTATTAGNITINGPITQTSGPLAITFTNNRMLILAGNMSYTGGTNVTGGGTIQVASGFALPTGGPVTISNGVLDLNNSSATIGTLTMGGGNGTLLTGTGTVTLGGDVNYNAGAGTANILGNLNLGATPRTFTIGQGTSGQPDMVVNGPISDSGGGFTKAGAGTLRLTGLNSSTGRVTVSAGTLQADGLASGSTLGSGTLNLTGGTMRLLNQGGGASNGSTGTLTFGGDTATPILLVDSNGNGATTLNLTAIGGRNAGATGVMTIVPSSGTLGANEKITLTNSPTGSLFVNNILPAYMTTQNSAGDNNLDFLTVDGSKNVLPAVYSSDINGGVNAVVALASGADIGSSNTRVFALKVNGNTVNGSGGTLTIGDDTNPAGLILNNGASIGASNLSFGPTGASEGIVWAGGGGANISSAMTLHNTLTTAGVQQINFSGPITLGTNSVTAQNTDNVGVSGATTTFSGNLAGGGLNKIGPGVLMLSGNNSAYTGTLTASVGTLQVGDGNTNGTLSATSALITNANLAFNRSDGVTFANPISGTGNVIQKGSGTLTLSGNLTYTGSTTGNAGTILLQATNRLPAASTLVTNTGAVFNMNGLSQSLLGINSNTGGGTIMNGGSTLSTLTLTGDGSFNGVIANGTGSIALVKNSGTQTIAPFVISAPSTYQSNSFSGGTQLNGGTLILGGATASMTSNPLGSGTITFNGGTLTMAGNTGNNGPDYGALTNTINVPANQTGTVNMTQRGTMNTPVVGAGSLNINTTFIRGQINNNFSAFTGTINFQSPNGASDARMNTATAAFSVNNFANATLNIGSNVYFYQISNFGAAGTTNLVGALTGTGTLGGGPVGGRILTYQVGGLNKDFTWGGNLGIGTSNTGAASLLKVGTGTATFTGSNVTTGTITVGGTGAGTIAPGGALVMGSGGDFTAASQVTVNSGATFGFSGTGTITGATRILVNSNGNFRVDNGLGTPSRVTLNGTGNIWGNYVHGAGTINAQGDGTTGILTFNNDLTLSPGGTVGVDVTNPGGAGAVGGVNDLLKVLGNFTLNAPSSSSSPIVRVKFLGTQPGAGDVGKTFPFLQYTGTGTGVDATSLGNVQVAAGVRGSFSIVPDGTLAKTLDIMVNSITVGAANLVWTGNLGNSWDVNSTANFKVGTSPAVYLEGDNVTFDSSGNTKTVALSAGVSPGSVMINNTSAVGDAYSIISNNGLGAINGTGGLTKNGTGIATLSTGNGYSGGTTINGGTLAVTNGTGAGTGSITVNNGGTLFFSPNFMGNQLNVGGTNSTATLSFANDNNLNYSGAIIGSGTLEVVNTHVNGTTIINLAGSIDAFAGTIDLSNVTAATAMRLNPGTNTNAPNVIFNVGNNTVTLQNRGGGTFTIGGVVGATNSSFSGSQAAGSPATTYNVGGANVNTEFAGVIGNGASTTNIIKVGNATWTLGGQNTYTGTTTVSAGTLAFNGAAFNASTFTANNGGTLAIQSANFNAPATTIALAAGGALNVTNAGNYNPGGSVTLIGTGGTVYGEYNHNQGTLSPGTGVLTIGTINFNDQLHLNGGTVQLDLNTNTATGSGTNDLIAIGSNGTLDLQSPTPLFVNFLTAPANNSDYTLIAYSHELGSLSNLTLNSRVNGGLVDTGSAIMLHVNSFSGATLTWASSGDNNWDVSNHANWTDSITTPDKFFQQDAVIFDDTPNVPQNIQINSPLIPSSVLINTSSNAFTFQGNGTITGGTSLTKTGSSTFTISNNNSYTGGTNINQGTLAITSAQPFIGTATISNGAALAAVQQGDQTLSFGAGATYLIPSGSNGTISLISNNSGSQTSGVEVGIAMNGTLSGGTTTSGSTANFLITNTNTNANLPVLTDINTNNTAFVGTINLLNNGTTTVRLGGNAGSANTFWNLTGGGTVATNAANETIAMGAVNGASNVVLQGFRGFNGGTTTNAAGGPATYQIGSLNLDSTLAGAIVDGTGTNNTIVSLAKFGTAKLTLNGTNTYTGQTTLNAGTLALGPTGSIANSATIQLSGGVLDATANANGYTSTGRAIQGTGSIFGNVTVGTGTLIPATVGTVGTLTFNNGLSLNSEAISADVATIGAIGGTNDLIDVTGALTLSGTSTVNASFLQNPAVGNYPIARYGSLAGTGTMQLGALGFRGTASISFAQPNVVNLAITALTPASLSWRGAGNNGGLWDINTTQNWINNAANDVFFQFDNVSFLDVASAQPAVVLNSVVSPGAVIVNSNTTNYGFSGNGRITGPGSLTKSGASTLTMGISNDYLGGTTINGGTIAVGSLGSGALGSGSIVLNGGVINASGTGTVFFSSQLNAAAASTSTLSVNGTGTVVNISGNLTGTGTVVMQSDNTGKIIDLNGSNATFGGAVVLNGTQTIRLGGNGGSGLALWSLPNGGSLSTNAGPATIPLGALSGSSTATLKGYNAGGTGGAVEYQIGGANQNATFAGNIIDGASGATARAVTITKVGNGQQTFSGSNGYTGGTHVNSGTLAFVGINAWTPALTGAAPTILNGGRLVFDYSGNVADNPAMTIKTILGAEASGSFLTGQLRTTNADDGRHAIGWFDNGSTKVTVGYTYLGDADVSGQVTTADFTLLGQNFGSTTAVWGQGDFNYDGKVNALDFNAIATNFGTTAIPAPVLGAPVLGSLVPEPTSLGMIALAGMGVSRRRRRA